MNFMYKYIIVDHIYNTEIIQGIISLVFNLVNMLVLQHVFNKQKLNTIDVIFMP